MRAVTCLVLLLVAAACGPEKPLVFVIFVPCLTGTDPNNRDVPEVCHSAQPFKEGRPFFVLRIQSEDGSRAVVEEPHIGLHGLPEGASTSAWLGVDGGQPRAFDVLEPAWRQFPQKVHLQDGALVDFDWGLEFCALTPDRYGFYGYSCDPMDFTGPQPVEKERFVVSPYAIAEQQRVVTQTWAFELVKK